MASRIDLLDGSRDSHYPAYVHRATRIDTGVMDTLNRLACLAAAGIQVPIVVVSLLDAGQHILLSSYGLPNPLATSPTLLELNSLCRQVATTGQPILVVDVRDCPTFYPTPLTTALGVTAFAGMPLLTVEGKGIGCFGIFDVRPRVWTDRELTILADLAVLGTREIERDMGVRGVNDHVAARLSEERWRALVQYASDVITLLSADGTILYQSPSFERILGHRLIDRIGRNIFAAPLGHPDDLVKKVDFLGAVLQRPGVNVTGEFRLQHADGSWRHMEALGINMLAEPLVGGIIATYRDISDRKALEERLAHRAFHDPLTALPNRALLLDRLTRALRHEAGGAGEIALLFLDLDRFKAVNDRLGHGAGDQLLLAVAARLRAHLRPDDTAARLGGDEFVILLEGIVGTADATDMAERLIVALESPFNVGGQRVQVSSSIGIALGKPGRDHPAGLLRQADIALYQAKAEGAAGYRIFDPEWA